jgi:acetyl-CoA carboxylase / biotin carboxylase 1
LCREIRLAGVPKRISSLSQQVDSFVKSIGGTAPIYSILVANNGIAAVKFIRSIRKWAFTTFGSDKAISLVAMATHIDIKSNAEHIHMADQFVEVPGGGSAENYGNVKLIGQIASQAAVDAVWPGWCVADHLAVHAHVYAHACTPCMPDASHLHYLCFGVLR